MSWIKDISEEISALDTSQKSLRKFGVLVGAVFCILSLWMAYKNHYTPRNLFGVVGVFLFIFGLVFPTALKWVYKIWMGLAFAMGWAVSRVLLLFVFFLVITPIGIGARLLGKEFLDIKKSNIRENYWIKRKKDNINYEKLY